MSSMHSPWLDTLQVGKSIGSFATIQAFGATLSTRPTFADDVSMLLRTGLGDWRDPITWPTSIFDDLTARSAFYGSLGFDPALTNFPAPAFEETVSLARLRRPPPPIVEAYGMPAPAAPDDEDEAALVRTNAAHDWLMRLETQLRQFIDQCMTAAVGPDWAKHRLPNDLFDKWMEKKRKAETAGAPERPVIAYADFTDYHPIICRQDNWREVFGPHFRRPESVRETLAPRCFKWVA